MSTTTHLKIKSLIIQKGVCINISVAILDLIRHQQIDFGLGITSKIGNFNVLNGSISFGHDVQIGDYNVFGPSTRISGKCSIGNENNFGVQSLVLQGMKIGNNTRIGLASVIIRNTQDNKLYFGNPAKKVEGLD